MIENALITGATGFIGRRLVDRLSAQGTHITQLVLPQESHTVVPGERCEVIPCDLEDLHAASARLRGRRFDVLYHLAWAGVSTDVKNDYAIQRKNLDYAGSVMALSADAGCKKVVCPGSVSEYAYVDGAVTGREAPCPADVYGAVKVAVHALCDVMARQNGLDFNWVLIPSIYGPGRKDNNLITYAITSLLKGERPRFTGLEQRWDYIYITDLIEALYLVGEKGVAGKTYVAGSGENRQLRAYVETLRDAMDPEAPLGIGELPYKTKRIDNAITDITALKRDTGYMPAVSFERGIRETIEYFKREQAERG